MSAEQAAKLEREEAELMKLAFGDPGEEQAKPVDAQVKPEPIEAPETVVEPVVATTPQDTTAVPLPQPEQDAAKELAQVTHRWNRYKATKDKQFVDLKNQVATLSSKLANALETINSFKAEPEESVIGFTEEDEQVLGKPALEVLNRARKEDYDRNIAPILAAEKKRKAEEIQALKDKASSEKSARVNKFEERLTKKVPEWATIAKSEDFHNFIAQDNGFGETHESVFRTAEKTLSASPILDIFLKYAKAKASNPELDRHIAPTAAASTVQPVVKGGEQPITQEYIDKFYADSARGVYNRTAELQKQSQEIEARIDAAIQASANRR